MRILLICEAFRSIGGVQEVVDNLAVELEKAGHQVAIFSTSFIAGQARTIRFEGECRYLEIPSRRPVTLRHLERLWQTRLSSEVRRLSSAIVGWQPRVVGSHCWSWDRFPSVAAACRNAGVPMVHSLYDSWGGGKMGAAALRSLQGAAALTALSAATRRFFQPVLPAARGARVIIGGVDPEAAQSAGPMPHSRPYILCAARLDIRHKAIDTLIEAFGILAAEYPDVDLYITGDGPDRQALEDLGRSAGVGERVRFIGIIKRSQLWDMYRNAVFFAMPSRMPEGLGLVFLEAMACGIPVIGTRSGGTPEIVDHGRTGLLVENNTPLELASAMRQLLNDPDERLRMGGRARELVASRYSWRQFALQYLEVCSSCVGANKGGVENAAGR
ncbi:MAG TPA: glycosyltransferase family 4 protein [Candidatus Binataceae bacterium]